MEHRLAMPGGLKPAPINLMSRVTRLAKALERYLQVHGIAIASPNRAGFDRGGSGHAHRLDEAGRARRSKRCHQTIRRLAFADAAHP